MASSYTKLTSSCKPLARSFGKLAEVLGKPDQPSSKLDQSLGNVVQTLGKPDQSSGKPDQSLDNVAQTLDSPDQPSGKPDQSLGNVAQTLDKPDQPSGKTLFNYQNAIKANKISATAVSSRNALKDVFVCWEEKLLMY